MTESFYSSLSPVDSFDALTVAGSYTPLPADWCVAIADVVNSTEAIASGNYKAVNTVGVSVITAITNALKPVEIPYVFGGDGALLCIPLSSLDAARSALAATAAMARVSFGLQLRAAVIPIPYIRSNNHDVLICRHRVSPHYDQCALYGGGEMFVDRELKSGRLPEELVIREDTSVTADFSGLECRWSEVPSPEEETIAVIVDASHRPERSLETYRNVMDTITNIYGTAEESRPVTEDRLRVTLSANALRHESRVRTWGSGTWRTFVYSLLQRVFVVIGWILFRLNVRTSETDWGTYKRDLVDNTDSRKFDGCLRLVLSGNKGKRKSLESALENLASSGKITYGIHVARSAIMTCLISKRQHEHVHFVDASGGGYAAAALSMKKRSMKS